MTLARPELPYKGWNKRVIREACNHLRVGFEQELHKIRGIWYWVIFGDVPAPWYWVDSNGTSHTVSRGATDMITGKSVSVAAGVTGPTSSKPTAETCAVIVCGYANQGFHIFLATGLQYGNANRGHEEQDLVTQDFVLSEVKRMFRDGEIRDAMTVRLLRRKIRS
jgi:hypothetical protein